MSTAETVFTDKELNTVSPRSLKDAASELGKRGMAVKRRKYTLAEMRLIAVENLKKARQARG